MGALLSIARHIFSTKKLDVCILGLDNSGKSTILEAMCGTLQLKNTVPTIGMNVKQLKTNGVTMKAFDLVRHGSSDGDCVFLLGRSAALP